MNILHKIRLHTKWFIRNTGLIKFIPLMGFCKKCGISVRDFYVPNYIWDHISPKIAHGNVICYQCFTDICKINHYESTFTLVPHNDMRRIKEIQSNLKLMLFSGGSYSENYKKELMGEMVRDLEAIVYGRTWTKNYWLEGSKKKRYNSINKITIGR